ncbi:MAG: hypothetical protein ABIN66_08685 [candidate division WOR-3 bacterium]
MDENIIPAPRRKGRERRKNMTLSPQVSSKLKLWLKSMGAKEGLVLDKVHI